MEPPLEPGMKVPGTDALAIGDMLQIQSQWQSARPEQVRYLQRKKRLHQSLVKARGEMYATVKALLQGNVPESEAQQQGVKYVAMSTLEDSRRLPSRLSPYGQPNLSRSLRSGTKSST